MKVSQIINNIDKISSEILNLEFRDIQIDSRLIKKGDIFFALDKKASLFIDDALERGAILIFQPKQIVKNNKLCFLSNNIIEDLSFALAKKYNNLPKNIFAVTGTKGKSSIANFFIQFNSILGKNSASIGTLGVKSNVPKIEELMQFSPLTTPDIVSLYRNLSILKKQGIENVIIEASSIGLDQKRLNNIKFKSGIFTNLSIDHLDYHKNMENYLSCKMKLFEDNISSGAAIINADCKDFNKVHSAISKTNNEIFSFGKNGDTIKIIDIQPNAQGHNISFSFNDSIFKAQINLLGEFQIYNILATLLLIIKNYHLQQEEIIKLIKNFKTLKAAQGRMQLIFNKEYKIYIDFAHNPESLEKSLLAVRKNTKRLLILFGCGGDRDKSKRSLMGKIATNIADLSIITDDNPRTEDPYSIRQDIIKGCKANKYTEIANRKTAIYEAIKNLQIGDILIIAGKGHEKYQIIGNKKNNFDEEKIINDLLLNDKNH
jgi:UDP-N-acetylmuramyl-tripeptide synthetase